MAFCCTGPFQSRYFCARFLSQPSAKDYSKADREIVCCPTRVGIAARCKGAKNDRTAQRAVACENGVVIELDNPQVNSWAYFHIKPATEFQREARSLVSGRHSFRKIN